MWQLFPPELHGKEDAMFSVIFEVRPNDGKKDVYLDLAKHLKPILEKIDGFVDNERFESLLRPGWVLSHSTWRDEKSVVRWRTEGEHHVVQAKGRFEIFQDYHLRVGDVTFDTDPPREAPVRERRFDETEVGKAKLVTFAEITPHKDAAFASRADLLPAHRGDRRTRRLGQHLQSRQDGAAGGLEGCGVRRPLDAETDRRGRDAAVPQGPCGARLRKVRPARGAAILSGRRGRRDEALRAGVLTDP
jgi:heme-degrading monooxygenase HmoA